MPARPRKPSAYYTGEMRTLYNKFWADLQADEAYQLRMGQKATQDGAEAYSSARILIMTALGIAAALCVAMGWLIVSGVSSPIRAMTGAMGRLAQHDLNTQIDGAERKDEIGQMANAVLVFKNSMIEADRLKAEQEEAQRVAVSPQRPGRQTDQRFRPQGPDRGPGRRRPGDARWNPRPRR